MSENRFESMPAGRRAGVFAAFFAVVFVVLFLLAEGAVRIRAMLSGGGDFRVESVYETDAETGLRIPKAGYRSERIAINALGFRGPEIEAAKPAGTTRIAFLGASTTFSAEVSSDEAVWPHVVVSMLRERFPARRFDYVNGGVPGYTLASSLANLQRRVGPLQPDVIVIYHATNDLSVHVRMAAEKHGIARAHGDSSLTWLSDYSLLAYLVEKNLRIMLRQQEAGEVAEHLIVRREELVPPFRVDLVALVRAAQAVAGRVYLVTFTTQLRPEQSPERQKDAAVTSLYYMPAMSIPGLLEAFALYNDTIAEVAAAEGAGLIAGHESVPGDPAHFTDSVHFTDAGSRANGERVFRGMLADGIEESWAAARGSGAQ